VHLEHISTDRDKAREEHSRLKNEEQTSREIE